MDQMNQEEKKPAAKKAAPKKLGMAKPAAKKAAPAKNTQSLRRPSAC